MNGGPPRPFWKVVPSYVAQALDLIVRVNEKIRKAVVFVGMEPDGFVPVGTGFLGSIQYPDDNGPHQLNFLVTADHLLDLIPGDEISVRMNRIGGGVSTIKIRKERKVTHSDAGCDVAMFNIPGIHEVYDHMYIPLSRETHLTLHQNIWSPELGDEVSTVGIYTSHFGETKNIPVVRTGNIAMMPDEPVLTHRGYTKAYLIEVRSIIGLSGSPVFLNPPDVGFVDGQIRAMPQKELITIGMMLGYHLRGSTEDQIIVPVIQGDDVGAEYSLDERNTGFAVVVPIERVFEIVERDDFKQMVARSVEHHLQQKKKGFRPAGVGGVGGPPASDANPSHREDFNSLLNAAVRKREPKD